MRVGAMKTKTIVLSILVVFLSQLAPQDLQHGVTVTLKLVQVYVVDRDGRPVTDLRASDFAVFDNGIRQTVTEFERHVLPFPGEGGERPASPGPLGTSAESALINRKFFLFFDYAFNTPKGIMKAREAALHFLETQVQPSDDVGILSYDILKGVSLREYLTKDHVKIRSSIEKVGLKNSLGRAESLENTFWNTLHGVESFDLSQPLKSGFDNHITGGTEATVSPVDKIANNREDKTQMRFFIAGMTELAKALRYVPGTKFVVLFSAGIPATILFGAQNLAGEHDTWVDRSSYQTKGSIGQGDHVLKTAYEAMLKELTGAGTAVFSFDTRDPEALLNTFGNDSRLTGAYALERLSGFTGGNYFGHIENYRHHLEKMQDLTGSYYVLGYPVREKWDGAYHRVKVEVSRKGCEVKAQRGYYGSKPFRDYSLLEKRLHLVDLALSDKPLFQTPLSLPSAPLLFLKGKSLAICYLSKFPGNGTRELVTPRAEVLTIIFDDREEIVSLQRAEVSNRDFSEEGTFYYSLHLLPPASYKIRIVVRNLETGDSAIGTGAVTIPQSPAKGMLLFPPLLLVPAPWGRYVKDAAEETSSGPEAPASLSGIFLFDQAEFSPALGEIPSDTRKLQAMLPILWAETSRPPLVFVSNLARTGSNQWFRLDTTVRYGTPIGTIGAGPAVYLLSLELGLPDLEAGEYTLHLAALETGSDGTSGVTTSLTIRER